MKTILGFMLVGMVVAIESIEKTADAIQVPAILRNSRLCIILLLSHQPSEVKTII